jgi:pimeloyl-ACP methyl ester carboxylesterase
VTPRTCAVDTRTTRFLPVVFTVVVLAAACSGDAGGADGSDGDGEAGAGTPATPAEVERFTGSVDAFYEVPDPLPAGEPGDLIRTMLIEAANPDEVGLRVMYHSTDAEGDDRAVTGLVYYPTDEPPDGGWPILAWAHGTSGLAAQCAPSRAPAAPPGFGVRGVRVATDYIGLGPDGELHPYLSAAAEGHAVVDGVAAVRALPETQAGDRWVVAGVSQGGHAALVTNEIAADRLPGAELLGAVAIAPGSQLSESYGDDLQIRVITTMVLFGIAAEDPEVDPRDYLRPDVHALAVGAIEDGCVADVMSDMVPVAGSPDFFVTDPRSDPLGSAWLEENDPGQVASDSPLLLVQGGQDPIVVPARTAALFERLCRLGQVVDEIDVPTANHDTVTDQAGDDITTWLAARFAGQPAADDC